MLKKRYKRLWAVFVIYFIIGLIIFMLSITLFPRLVTEIKIIEWVTSDWKVATIICTADI